MKWSLALALAGVLWSSQARANAYAPWVDCEGLEDGDKCGSFGGYYNGHCVLHEEDCSTDTAADTGGDSASDVNTCLTCDDDPGCGGCSATGSAEEAVFGLQAIAGVVGLGMLMVRRRA